MQSTVCAVGDLNEDGRSDIAVGLFEADEMRVYSPSPGARRETGGWTRIRTIRPTQAADPSIESK